MKKQVQICCLILIIFVINEFSCVPIFTEESLHSIVISEVDLPTEASTSAEKEIIEPEKTESFVELYEKYDELFIKNSTSETAEDSENPLQKRSSDDEAIDDDVNGKSIIDKIQTIVDPEVRKEFEFEITNNGQSLESEKVEDDGTIEFEPNYAKKIVTDKLVEVETHDSDNSIQSFHVDDAGKKMTIHEKEVLQGHMVEQLVHMNDSNVEFTTIIPEDSFTHHDHIKNPEVVEVLEHIVYQSNNMEMIEMTTLDALNVQVDFDPIEIIPKDRHRFRNIDTEVTTVPNDKFVGFQPTEDLVEDGEETTESDKFFKKVETEEDSAERTADAIVETLEYVGLFGKSIRFPETTEKVEIENADKEIEVTVTEIPEKFYEIDIAENVESKTEIVEVHTEISVTIHIGDNKEETEKQNSSEESGKQSSQSNKSSEESNSSKSSESKDKVSTDKTTKDSAESSEETNNNAREIFDTDELRILDLQDTKSQKSLMDDLYKETLKHDVKKKDHAEERSLPSEVSERKFNAEDEIAQHLEDKMKPQQEETTTVGIYETIEDVVTTVSDGIKLSNDFRATLDSFRDFAEENKTVLDTNSEIVSSKNIKNSLVNIAEGMTLENHVESSKVSYLMVSFIGFISATVLLTLYTVMKRISARIISST